MNVLVATRPEPHRVVDDDGNAEPYRWQLSIDDRVAIEAAMDIGDQVTAISIGGDPANQCARSALQRGVDRAIHVAFDPIEDVVGEKYATVLARIAAREAPDVVMLGETSSFTGAEVAGFTAARLDWPTATRVTELGADDLDIDVDTDSDKIAVQRKLAIGRQEAIAVTAPMVLGIDSGYTDPSRAPLDTMIAGQQATIETVPLSDVAPGESRFSMSVGATTIEDTTPNERWGRGRPPRTGSVEERIYRMLGRGGSEEKSAGDVIDAPPEEAAAQIVAFLRENELA